MKILLVGFQSFDEKIYPHTMHFVNALREKIEVDYYNSDEKGFFLYDYQEKPFCKQARKATKRAFKNLFHTISDVKKMDKKNKYDYILVIDDFNFWGLSFFIKKEKLVYYSYDYHSPDTTLGKLWLTKLILTRNLKLLKTGIPFVIQDEQRKKDFEEAMQIDLKNVFLIPIFLKKIPAVEPGTKTSSNIPVLMQFGAGCTIRQSDKLIENCIQNNFPYSLYLHGYIEPQIKSMIDDANSPHIVCNQEWFSIDEYNKVLKKADIGFICYSFNRDFNNRHLFFANGRIPEFLKMAKPIISIQNDDIAYHIDKYKIGVSVNSMQEVPDAVERIKNNYGEYSRNALKCFDEVFSHELYVDNFINWLKSNSNKKYNY